MFKKGTKIYSIVNGKCPQCHEGDFFLNGFTFNPNKITKIHDNCPKCGLKYMLEPSFFFGAMFVNYGIAVALFVGIFIIAKMFLGFTILNSFITIVVVSLLLTPVTLRLSRIIWINMFVGYEKKAGNEKLEV